MSCTLGVGARQIPICLRRGHTAPGGFEIRTGGQIGLFRTRLHGGPRITCLQRSCLALPANQIRQHVARLFELGLRLTRVVIGTGFIDGQTRHLYRRDIAGFQTTFCHLEAARLQLGRLLRQASLLLRQQQAVIRPAQPGQLLSCHIVEILTSRLQPRFGTTHTQGTLVAALDHLIDLAERFWR